MNFDMDNVDTERLWLNSFADKTGAGREATGDEVLLLEKYDATPVQCLWEGTCVLFYSGGKAMAGVTRYSGRNSHVIMHSCDGLSTEFSMDFAGKVVSVGMHGDYENRRCEQFYDHVVALMRERFAGITAREVQEAFAHVGDTWHDMFGEAYEVDAE